MGIWERTTPTGICGGLRCRVPHPTFYLDDLLKCDRIIDGDRVGIAYTDGDWLKLIRGYLLSVSKTVCASDKEKKMI
ncbi:hypothetical protein BJP34_03070 [Moorena producens PAL-8-15-08-1]|uniref:Uncharacterized protein n=1 Tax=Moorena producens PAL-8-15-08-1 TaxID=1458985 RepID=A0A1D8TLU2_9CYAN|nr:hypothetical protein [Moorena producens]AOW98563.1 hypothetical protein BJP34_03070 [Moorena producens PAL-8-15-08-1]